jgi:serine/threonine-protein kinase
MSDQLSSLQAACGDQYRLQHVIGEGGMGTVVLAEDTKHHRQVAIKVLRPEIAEVVGDRFLREIEIVAQLQHPHILPLHDSCQDQACLYYVMPFVDGESLRARLEREGRLEVDDALRIATEVLDALEYAHQRGVVHRDIKPENILLSAGHALLADFGIARAVDVAGGSTLTQAGFVVGTPGYMSPEQATGDANVDARSDVYGLACVLYELLTGENPFGRGTTPEIIARQVREPTPSPRRVRPNIPVSLDGVIQRALSSSPERRFASAQEFAAALRAPASPPTPVRGKWIVGIAAVAALVVAALGIWRLTGGEPAHVSRTAVAVFPFAVRGGPEVTYLSEGMVSLLSTKLDGAGDLRSVDPNAVLSQVSEGSAIPGPADGREIARRFGAGLFVLGDVVEAGGQIQISAVLYETAGGLEPVARVTLDGDARDLFAVVDGLATDLLTRWSVTTGSSLVGITSVTTESLPALKAYLEGEQAFRRASYEVALASFQRAVSEDSLFALAWYGLSMAAEWLTEGELSREAAERALALKERLPQRELDLLEANVANRYGDSDEAERRYRRIIAEQPEDIQAWFQLGEVLYHYNPARGRSFTESKAAWERVLAIEPHHVAGLLHMARIAASERDLFALDELLARLRVAPSGESRRAEALEISILRAFVAQDSAGMSEELAALAVASSITKSLVLTNSLLLADDLDAVRLTAEALIGPEQSPATRAEALTRLAYDAAWRGRWAEADAYLDQVAVLDAAAALEHLVVLATAPHAPATPERLRLLRGQVEQFDADDVEPLAGATGMYHTVHDGVHALLKIYLTALLDLLLGDSEAVRQAASSLDEQTAGSHAALARGLAATLRAEVAMEDRQFEEALTELDAATSMGLYNAMVASPFYGMTRPRYLRAVALSALGRTDEALAWLSPEPPWLPFDLVYNPAVLLDRARILREAGRAREAAAALSRFVTLWDGADASVQDHVEDARAELARLAAQ